MLMFTRRRKVAELLFRALSWFKLPMAAAALMFATACFTTSQAKPIVPGVSRFLDGLSDRTVMFVSRAGGMPFCGGVYISEHAVLTAYHCVDSVKWCTDDMGTSLTSCSQSDAGIEAEYSTTKHAFLFYTYEDHKSDTVNMTEPWIAVLVKHDERADLALLYTRRASDASAVLANMLPEPGSVAYVIGHPEWVSYALLPVHIRWNGMRTLSNGSAIFSRHVTTIDKRVAGGTSGGGAWNESGELIGICLSRSVIFSESYFASVIEIETFLAQ